MYPTQESTCFVCACTCVFCGSEDDDVTEMIIKRNSTDLLIQHEQIHQRLSYWDGETGFLSNLHSPTKEPFKWCSHNAAKLCCWLQHCRIYSECSVRSLRMELVLAEVVCDLNSKKISQVKIPLHITCHIFYKHRSCDHISPVQIGIWVIWGRIIIITQSLEIISRRWCQESFSHVSRWPTAVLQQ